MNTQDVTVTMDALGEEEETEVSYRVVGMVRVWKRIDTVVTVSLDDGDDPLETALDAARQELADDLDIDIEATEWNEPDSVLAFAVDEVPHTGRGYPFHPSYHPTATSGCNRCSHHPAKKPADCSCDCHDIVG